MNEDCHDQDCFIQDKSGHRYRVNLVETPHWYLKVWDGPVEVGYANCHIEPQVLYVDDLRIADAALRPASFMRRVLKQPNKPINYRNHGVGSALLRLIAKLATERGLRAVEGSLSQNDLENPALIAWYRRLGFAILTGGRHAPGIVRLELAASES